MTVRRPHRTAPVHPAVWTALTARVAAEFGVAADAVRAVDPRWAWVPEPLWIARAACLTGLRRAGYGRRPIATVSGRTLDQVRHPIAVMAAIAPQDVRVARLIARVDAMMDQIRAAHLAGRIAA